MPKRNFFQPTSALVCSLFAVACTTSPTDVTPVDDDASASIANNAVVCGDGVVCPGEECDDGNTEDGDGCSSTCENEPPPEEPCCGNGVVEEGEQCDDGNTSSDDGCSATCQTEDDCSCPSDGGHDGGTCPGPAPDTAVNVDATVHLEVGVDVTGTTLLGAACTAASIDLPIDLDASVQILGGQLLLTDIDALPTLSLNDVITSVLAAGGSILSGCIPTGVDITDATGATLSLDVAASGAVCQLYCLVDLQAQLDLCGSDATCIANVNINQPSACDTECCEAVTVHLDVDLESILDSLSTAVGGGDVTSLIGSVLGILDGDLLP
jgi:cysteine-rich repeat protein